MARATAVMGPDYSLRWHEPGVECSRGGPYRLACLPNRIGSACPAGGYSYVRHLLGSSNFIIFFVLFFFVIYFFGSIICCSLFLSVCLFHVRSCLFFILFFQFV